MEYIDGGSALDKVKEEVMEEKQVAVVVSEVLHGMSRKYLV